MEVDTMAQLLVRNLDGAIKDALRSRAVAHGRSMEEEARVLLSVALVQPIAHAKATPLGARMASRFKGIGTPSPIEAVRGIAIEPIKF
jgi:antitoxin FitA